MSVCLFVCLSPVILCSHSFFFFLCENLFLCFLFVCRVLSWLWVFLFVKSGFFAKCGCFCWKASVPSWNQGFFVKSECFLQIVDVFLWIWMFLQNLDVFYKSGSSLQNLDVPSWNQGFFVKSECFLQNVDVFVKCGCLCKIWMFLSKFECFCKIWIFL